MRKRYHCFIFYLAMFFFRFLALLLGGDMYVALLYSPKRPNYYIRFDQNREKSGPSTESYEPNLIDF